MSRPLLQHGVGDLEALFASSKSDHKVLKQLEDELEYRHVPRAVALMAEVQRALKGVPPTGVPLPATVAFAIPTKLPSEPVMPLEEAYKVLKATPGSTWESIEMTRRQLVEQSNPERAKSVSSEKWSQSLAQASRVNAAYEAVLRARAS
jgi:DnaJ-domain-containing protein 1